MVELEIFPEFIPIETYESLKNIFELLLFGSAIHGGVKQQKIKLIKLIDYDRY